MVLPPIHSLYETCATARTVRLQQTLQRAVAIPHISIQGSSRSNNCSPQIHISVTAQDPREDSNDDGHFLIFPPANYPKPSLNLLPTSLPASCIIPLAQPLPQPHRRNYPREFASRETITGPLRRTKVQRRTASCIPQQLITSPSGWPQLPLIL